MVKQNTVDIKELFYDLQKEMLDSYKTNNAIKHMPSKGDNNEIIWIEWLRKYLPKRYSVDKAIIIDNNGYTSDQIDLVIYDMQYTPFVFNKGNMKYIPAESVYAVFEIKPTINKEYIEYAKNKIKSVRNLERTSASIHHAGGTFDPKKPHNIIGGILTNKVEWQKKFGKEFKENILSNANITNRIDLGIALEEGTFEITYDKDKKPQFFVSKKNEALITFFVKMIVTLQKCGTVPAIDITKYAKALDSI
ncbi:MAG: hypothetical protein LBL91_03985 [Lachnospiraceae bacterium]|jgi:hypothetical protein|nr:hypothetical protein [Lachnospiraceae bacterium]